MTQEQTPSKAEVTRQHILDSGHRLVLRKGYSGLGLQEILAAAAVPKGSFYYYFASKEAFGTALLQDYVQRYAARLDGLLARPGNGKQQLLRYFTAWIRDPEDDSRPGWAEGCLVVKLAAEVADLSDAMRQVLDAGVARLIERCAALITLARADGSLPAGAEPQALARVLYQMWLGAALLRKLGGTDRPLLDALAATEALLTCPASAPDRATP